MVENEHKYLLNKLPQMGDFPPGIHPRMSTITQVYLANDEPGMTERVRHRWYHGGGSEQPGRHTYTHTLKRHLGPGSNEETEQDIGSHSFERMIELRQDPATKKLVKYRMVFDWGGLTWEIDEFTNGLYLLEVEMDELREVETPPWLDVGDQVTGNALYANVVIARKNWSDRGTRTAWFEGLAAFLRLTLHVKGITLAVDRAYHNEIWLKDPYSYRNSGGELYVRLRDSCESPDDDFQLTCWASLETSDEVSHTRGHWSEAQNGRARLQELATDITEKLRADQWAEDPPECRECGGPCRFREWLPEENVVTLLAEAEHATMLWSMHEPLLNHPAFKRVVAMGPDAAPALFALMRFHAEVRTRGRGRADPNRQASEPPGPSWGVFLALESIFGEDGPEHAEEDAGRLINLTNNWWRWGEERGLTPEH